MSPAHAVKDPPFSLIESRKRVVWICCNTSSSSSSFVKSSAVKHSRVYDVHEALEVTVFDEDPNKKFEFLGRVRIPLLSIENGVKKWFALKDKRCVSRSKGQIQLEFSLVYNPLRACIRTLNPRETKLLTPDLKFKRSVFIRNVNRTKATTIEFLEVIRFVKSCFQWESVPRSLTAFALFLLIVFFFELWMAPASLLLLFAIKPAQRFFQSRIGSKAAPTTTTATAAAVSSTSLEVCTTEELDAEEEQMPAVDDATDEAVEDKKSMRQKLQQVQEITALVQNILGEIASLGDRVRKYVLLF